MSQFYARYIPETAAPTSSKAPHSKVGKRKHAEESPRRDKSRKKQKSAEQTKQDVGPAQKAAQKSDASTESRSQIALPYHGHSVLEKYSVTAAAKADHIPDIRHRKSKAAIPTHDKISDHRDSPNTLKKPKRIKKNLEPEKDGLGDQASPEDEYHKRHARVLSKFSESGSKGRSANDISASDQASPPKILKVQPEDTHGLYPIPQPLEAEVISDKPSYSTLPVWQSEAIRVVHGTRPKFESLSLSKIVKANLKKNGLDQAFPIQSTVIPLLLDGPQKHHGDVCVSAATGSGKTLAYVIPMIEALKDVATTKLRGVIVVPTRELVQQVRQLCEICSAGTNLNIATSLGSKSLKEEQDLFVQEQEVYDPVEYEKQQQSSIDWSAFSIEKLMRETQTRKLIDTVHFVKRFQSKVDILITTPGRLVDHLRSTPGFNLDDVRWLVVDEADRLLNESYQEWVEIVVPALQSQTATADRDEVLRYMRMKPPRRSVTKVLLSATMTRDVSKLNSLGLENPKLVILGHGALDENSQIPVENLAEDVGQFHLPSTLSEAAIPVKDGSEKPLFLLELLQEHVVQKLKNSDEPDTSSSGSSSSSSDDSSLSSLSDPSSELTSDSDSDSESGSSSDSYLEADNAAAKANSFLAHHLKSNKPTTSQHPQALVFTRSTASATRLSRLIILLSPSLAPKISTLTRSTASSSTSRRAFTAFRSGKTSVLIATDRASRGLDVPDLAHVISYDVPASALTYVHRVGRTARAGKEGTAWTLVEHREGAWFWREIGGKAGRDSGKVPTAGGVGGESNEPEVKIQRRGKIKRVQMAIEDEALKGRYEEALKQLGKEVRGQ